MYIRLFVPPVKCVSAVCMVLIVNGYHCCGKGTVYLLCNMDKQSFQRKYKNSAPL